MIRFEEFVIGEMFDIATGRDLIIGNTMAGDIPLISHQNTNNGIVKYISKVEDRRIFDHNKTIALADRGLFYATVQSKDFHIGTRVKALTLKGDVQKREVLMYLVAAINKQQILFTEYLVNATDKLPSLTIKLPVCVDSDGKTIRDSSKIYSHKGYIPNFKLMQERIARIVQERITELEKYLIATGLDDYELNAEDKKVIALKKQTKTFCVADLFDVKTPKKRINANTVRIYDYKRGNPYVVRTSQNNGIRGYIEYDKQYLNEGHTISFGQDTATMFYQEQPYFTGDKIKIFALKDKELSAEIANYLITCVQNAFVMFSWGQSKFEESIIKSVTFNLPIMHNDDNTAIIDSEYKYHMDGYIPDFAYMEKYIRAMKKKVIADVVKYKDEIISQTKEIILE